MPKRSGSAGPAVYLDFNPLIYLLEGEPSVSAAVDPLFRVLRNKPGLGITSEITLAEVLAPSQRNGALELHVKRRPYLNLIVFGGFLSLSPVSRDDLYETADLRKVVPMKLVDAIHLVTAMQHRCGYFVSADRDFDRIPRGMVRIAPDAAGISSLVTRLNA
jgi:predicted nucleic acid-binding protein